jgi:hypothetical protein
MSEPKPANIASNVLTFLAVASATVKIDASFGRFCPGNRLWAAKPARRSASMISRRRSSLTFSLNLNWTEI